MATQTSIVREAPNIEAYKLGLLQSAKQLADLGVDLPPQQIAGMTDLQLAALNRAGQGIGNFVPYLTAGGRSLGQAGGQLFGSLQDLARAQQPIGSLREQQNILRGLIDQNQRPPRPIVVPTSGGATVSMDPTQFLSPRNQPMERRTGRPNLRQGYPSVLMREEQQPPEPPMMDAPPPPLAIMGESPDILRPPMMDMPPPPIVADRRSPIRANLLPLPQPMPEQTGFDRARGLAEESRGLADRTRFMGDAGFGQARAGVGAAGRRLGQELGFGSEARTGFRRGADIVEEATGSDFLTGAQQFDPSGIGAFMSPYQQQVIDQSLQDIQRAGDIAAQRQSADAIAAGAFGGSRGELGRQELQRNILEQQARTSAQMRDAGFRDAAARAQQAFEAQQSRGITGATTRGQLGSQLANIASQRGQFGLAGTGQALDIGQALGSLAQSQYGLGLQSAGQRADLANLMAGLTGQEERLGMDRTQLTAALADQLGRSGLQQGQFGLQSAGQRAQLADQLGTLGLRQASLGELGQTLGQREGQFLFDMGRQGQAQQQAELEALRQSQLAQAFEPYQRVSFLSDIYRGAPSTQQTVAGFTSPQASTAQQLLGLGIAGLGAVGGARRMMGGF